MIHGIIPPLVTPLADRDRLDEAGLECLLDHQIQASVDGIFILGTTGEGPSLSDSLQRAMIQETSRFTKGRLPIYVGITDTSLVRAIDLAVFARDHGASAVVAAPPFYFPAGQTELTNWFTELAESLPLPLILYNMPSCVKISIEPETLRRLLELDNIIGLKDSSGDLEYFAKAIEVADLRSEWPVLMGPEALLLDAMRAGAAGGVAGGANLYPQLFVQLMRAIRENREVDINRLQPIIIELQSLYGFGKYGSSYLKGLKCALEINGICSGRPASPFDDFKTPQRKQVQEWLEDFSKQHLSFDN